MVCVACAGKLFRRVFKYVVDEPKPLPNVFRPALTYKNALASDKLPWTPIDGDGLKTLQKPKPHRTDNLRMHL
jgi:hypothetical protein